MKRLEPNLQAYIRRRTLRPDPNGSAEEHSYQVGEHTDTRDLWQRSSDHPDLLVGERLEGNDMDMKAAPFKRRDAFRIPNLANDLSRVGHESYSSLPIVL
jgi:hypothetical protein